MEVSSFINAAEARDLIKLSTAADLLFANDSEKKLYWDRSSYESPEAQMKALAKSKTLYVGNLAFSTRSHNILSHFSQIGPVRKIHMGLDRVKKTPCGFCFCEYYNRSDALQAVAHLTETKLDGRVIRVELDAGFQPGRQFGRGTSGGQVRDDRRSRQDPARMMQRHRPKWTPPVKDDDSSLNRYGSGGGEKRERDDGDVDMETNKRLRRE
jgi:nuclear cap-binding protein subunit 2